MLLQARYEGLREKMQVVKSLYTSRHYTQCTRYGETLLAEIKEEIHPIHRAYLNFYIALSHDTLARETSLKNRIKELNLAEKHYVAAIAALTPSHLQSTEDDHLVSPTSSPQEEGAIWRLRRSSSAASSSASTSPESSPNLDSYSFPQTPATILTVMSSRPQTPEEYQIAADTMSFVRMIRSHLSNVRDMKEKTNDRSSVRFSAIESRMSSMLETPNLASRHDRETVRQSMRADRMALKWRPRFDPSSVQQLCHEALAELH